MTIDAARIAMVDDNVQLISNLKALLNMKGYQNITVHKSGEEFLEFYCDEGTEPPDIVFLDILLDPHDRSINGFKVLGDALQHEKLSKALFVSVSAFFNEHDSRWLGHVGFDYNLPKHELTEKLEETIELLSADREAFLLKRNPYGNLVAAAHELSRLKLRSAVLENDYIKKLISPEVFAILDSSPKSLVPKNQEIAVGFVDIRGFTQLMNRLQIQQMNEILKIFFEYTIEAVMKERGFIDKFLGDGVMWFHTSDSLEDSCTHCLRAAIRMMQGIRILNGAIKNRLHMGLGIQIGVGVACGTTAVGIFGAPKYRIQYSVIGPPVNLAARLCSEARANEVLIGGEAIEFCPFRTKKIGFRSIKGFDHDVELRSVIIPKKKLTS